VNLAKLLLDGTEIRPGYPISVTEAKFEHKQGTAPVQRAKSKTKKKKKPRLNQEDELRWEDWETRQHVILFNMFDPKDARGDPDFYTELQRDVREEVEKLGAVETVHVFERNPQGVVALKFEDPLAAEKCIKVMSGRWFAKKQIRAEWYDGLTDYSVKESEEDEAKRLEDFGNWLENQSSSSDDEDSAQASRKQ